MEIVRNRFKDPQLEKAINAVRFVAQHVKNEDKYNKVFTTKINLQQGLVL